MTVKFARFLTAVLVLLMVVGLAGAVWAAEPDGTLDAFINATTKASSSEVKSEPVPGAEIVPDVKLWIGQNRALVNGESKNLDTAPMLYEDRTMVPLRFIAEALGADVKWDPAEQKIMIDGGEGSGPAEKTQFDVILKIGQNQALVNGKSKTLDVPPILYQDRTMVPLRFIAEALGSDVKYDSAEQCVTIALAAVPSGPASKSSLYVVSTDPANNATNVSPNKTITVTFNEAVQPGSTYNNISVKNTTTGNSVLIQTNFVNMYLYIQPFSGWSWNGEYVVTIPAGAVMTAASHSGGHPSLGSTYTFKFSIEDTTPPAVVSTYPANNATSVPVNSIITVTFNENIQQGSASAYDNISLKDAAGNVVSKLRQINGKFLIITPGSPSPLPNMEDISAEFTTKSLKWYHVNLAPNTLYIVTIPVGAVKDSAGNALVQTYSFHFTTGVANTANQTPVPGAEITIEQIPVKTTGIDSQEPAEKTQFDAILKPINCKTNDKGEFSFSIPEEQFKKLPGEISLQMTIIPPKGWTGISSSNKVTVKVRKSADPKFEFVLLWQKEGDIKTNKGSFAINAKTQT